MAPAGPRPSIRRAAELLDAGVAPCWRHTAGCDALNTSESWRGYARLPRTTNRPSAILLLEGLQRRLCARVGLFSEQPRIDSCLQRLATPGDRAVDERRGSCIGSNVASGVSTSVKAGASKIQGMGGHCRATLPGGSKSRDRRKRTPQERMVPTSAAGRRHGAFLLRRRLAVHGVLCTRVCATALAASTAISCR